MCTHSTDKIRLLAKDRGALQDLNWLVIIKTSGEINLCGLKRFHRGMTNFVYLNLSKICVAAVVQGTRYVRTCASSLDDYTYTYPGPQTESIIQSHGGRNVDQGLTMFSRSTVIIVEH